jgi:hypothetical protein
MTTSAVSPCDLMILKRSPLGGLSGDLRRRRWLCEATSWRVSGTLIGIQSIMDAGRAGRWERDRAGQLTLTCAKQLQERKKKLCVSNRPAAVLSGTGCGGWCQADMCDPGWSELMLAMARRSVSCSRSFAVDVAEAEHPGGLGVDDQLELG